MAILLNRFSTVIFCLALCLASLFVLTGRSQSIADEWLRVLTDEDSITEVDRSSLELESGQVIRALFRTTFTEPLPTIGKLQYQSRRDSIEFSVSDRRYRIRETKFVDGSGKVISLGSPIATNWNSLEGRTGTALFSAAKQLQPFGNWKVVSYRYAAGHSPSDNEPTELKRLVGSNIYLTLDRVNIEDLTCDSPAFEPTVITDEEFARRIGSSLKSLEMPDRADAMYLSCTENRTESRTNEGPPSLSYRGVATGIIISSGVNADRQNATIYPAKTLLLRRPNNTMVMLWDGVFLELERTKNIFLPRSYQ